MTAPLVDFVAATAAQFGIPGAAVGVLADSHEEVACHGATIVDNPLPVDSDTLCLLGSVNRPASRATAARPVTDPTIPHLVATSPNVASPAWQKLTQVARDRDYDSS